MTFRCTDQHVADFHHHGWTVFRGVIPPTLVADLRRACAVGADQVRVARGPDIQRFQPVGACAVDHGPFRDYLALPALVDAIRAVLSPAHAMAGLDLMGVLIEPSARPWCTGWHRDYVRPGWPDDVMADVWARAADPRYFNQLNCALYDDASLWLVPGSAARPGLPEEDAARDDFEAHRAAAAALPPAEAERRDLAYIRSMPGAMNVALAAGDFALYRQNLWHAGRYTPCRRRATIHDHVDTPENAAWMRALRERFAARAA